MKIWGMWDSVADCWLGTDAGLITETDYAMAQVDAMLIDVHFCWPLGRTKARELPKRVTWVERAPLAKTA
jgi:hypothetical protein